MASNSPHGKFIEQTEAIILEHISDEQFGVSELADIMHMSRSNLLRKIKKNTNLSASQFIRQVRLQKGKELLEQTELNVTEISYQVGFGNSSYFIKCFKELYGYPPGETRKRVSQSLKSDENVNELASTTNSIQKKYRWHLVIIALLIISLGAFLIYKKSTPTKVILEPQEITKSIAVLPFKNMSSDSTNLYFVNGLMESTLNNLQKIEDLRVISRTSVEKFRNSQLTIPEIAKELQVNYIIEGSGQRVDDEVLLNIHLIEVSKDKPIWIEQYQHKVVDIFNLQNEVAKKISVAIEATVTPAEMEQIDKKPTQSLEAYDYYLQALEPYHKETKEGLEKCIPLFEKAITYDPQFALAYSKIAIAYYFLDVHQKEKQYTEVINNYADKALLYDSKSAESLIAKALYYMNNEEYRLAVPHLEKALEYNPNSSAVVQMLSNLYAYNLPNTSKFLKNALKGIQLDIAANDSIGKSYIYLQLSNALIQNGFKEEAMKYIDLSLNYYPENDYAPYLKIFIQLAKDNDLKLATQSLTKELEKDTTRIDIMQEVAKLYYYQEDYTNAYNYYKKYVAIKQKQGLNVYPHEDLKIGIVYEKMGYPDQAEQFYKAYALYCKNDQSIYQPASMAMLYLRQKKFDLAIEQLNAFGNNSGYQYWMLIFLEQDPLMKSLKNHPGYDHVIRQIENQFWENQKQLKKSLEDNGLI